MTSLALILADLNYQSTEIRMTSVSMILIIMSYIRHSGYQFSRFIFGLLCLRTREN
jgi:hypothetical protein